LNGQNVAIAMYRSGIFYEKVKEFLEAHRISNGNHERRLTYGKLQFSPLRSFLLRRDYVCYDTSPLFQHNENFGG